MFWPRLNQSCLTREACTSQTNASSALDRVIGKCTSYHAGGAANRMRNLALSRAWEKWQQARSPCRYSMCEYMYLQQSSLLRLSLYPASYESIYAYMCICMRICPETWKQAWASHMVILPVQTHTFAVLYRPHSLSLIISTVQYYTSRYDMCAYICVHIYTYTYTYVYRHVESPTFYIYRGLRLVPSTY